MELKPGQYVPIETPKLYKREMGGNSLPHTSTFQSFNLSNYAGYGFASRAMIPARPITFSYITLKEPKMFHGFESKAKSYSQSAASDFMLMHGAVVPTRCRTLG